MAVAMYENYPDFPIGRFDDVTEDALEDDVDIPQISISDSEAFDTDLEEDFTIECLFEKSTSL